MLIKYELEGVMGFDINNEIKRLEIKLKDNYELQDQNLDNNKLQEELANLASGIRYEINDLKNK